MRPDENHRQGSGSRTACAAPAAETALNRRPQNAVRHAWLATLVLFCGGIASAQDKPAAPQEPEKPGSVAPVATPADAADTALAARVEELSRRLAQQDEELARQRKELDSYKAQLDAPTSGATPKPATNAGDDPALAELLSQRDEEAPMAFEPQLRVYGFADLGLQRAWGGLFDSGLSLSNATNFVLGNVNIYFDATPFKNWRFLTEVRFTNFPNGAESADLSSGNFTRAQTGIYDYTSTAGGFVTVRWAGIVLERAHIDWTPSDAFNVRTGYFLTPYGIWNVDHGSPTRIMLRAPFFESLEYFPERQTGVELFGVFHALPWELGYHAYVSNGRVAGAVDFDDDKAIGGRVFARTRRPFPMQFGASIFKGSTEDFSKSATILPDGTPGVARKQTIGYDELNGAGDVSMDLGPLRIRAEFAAHRIVYQPGKRAITLGAPAANVTALGGYLLLAYRLPWYGLEPLVETEYLRYPTFVTGEAVVVPGAGLNVYLNTAVTLRMQYSYVMPVRFDSSQKDESGHYLHLLSSRLIIAF